MPRAADKGGGVLTINSAGADSAGPGPVRAGSLIAKLAESDADVAAVQQLRYRVFYEEMLASASPEMRAEKRDFDHIDTGCDHLMVLDTERAGDGAVVGTYRLLRREQAMALGGFYSSDEYDISRITAYSQKVLELGRSCVDADYRTRAIMQLMWRSIAAYVFHYDIELMFGCASLPGTDPTALAQPLSYLYHYHLAPPALRPRALEQRYIDMRLLPQADIDAKAALGALPPLIKGYLRLGGFVGDGAVVDQQFNTTDVSIVVKTELVTEKYSRHYERTTRPDGQG